MEKQTGRRWAAVLICAALALVWAVQSSALDLPLQWDAPARLPAALAQQGDWRVSQDVWLDPGRYTVEWEGENGPEAFVLAPDALSADNREGVRLNEDGGPSFTVSGQRGRVQVWVDGQAPSARLTSGLFCERDGLLAVAALTAAAVLLLARGPRTGAQKRCWRCWSAVRWPPACPCSPPACPTGRTCTFI